MKDKIHRLNSSYTPEAIFEICKKKHSNSRAVIIIGIDRGKDNMDSYWIEGSNSTFEEKCALQSYLNAWFTGTQWFDLQ